jgi:hypothetical protein
MPFACAAVLLLDIQRTLTVRTATQYTGPGIIHGAMFYYLSQKCLSCVRLLLLLDIQRTLTVRTATQYTGPGIIHDVMFYYLSQKCLSCVRLLLLLDIQRTLTVRTATQYTGPGIIHDGTSCFIATIYRSSSVYDCFLSRRIKRRGSGGVAHGGHWNCDGRC